MSDETKQEPTMEEILASIRRIISEEDIDPPKEPEEEEDGFPPMPAAELEPDEAEPDVPHQDEDVLELTERIEPLGDIEPALVSEPTAAVAAAAFGQLSASIQMPGDLRTLEDVVRELLRPLLKTWLDENLPHIVEAQVQAEIERISRGGRGR